METIAITPGKRRGTVQVPYSKSHLHRLLIATFLSGHREFGNSYDGIGADVDATLRCLKALEDGMASSDAPVLYCGESGSTLRFMLPVAMTQVDSAVFTAAGRLPQRPIAPFLEILASHGVTADNSSFPLHLRGRLASGEFLVRGDISSQIVTGLLFALPCLDGDSVITLTTPLESRGYVDMTLDVMRKFGIDVSACDDSFAIAGRQQYRMPDGIAPERDWSGAAFWFVMDFLGAEIVIPGLDSDSRQPDKKIIQLLEFQQDTIDVSQCPDNFPVLAVAAGARRGDTEFIGVRRLRLKESDRIAAMADVLSRFGVRTEAGDDFFVVHGKGPRFRGGVTIDTYSDHRIAMAAAVAATVADSPVLIENPSCIAKSYPDFFRQLENTDII
ncbi:MAG: 3-phosphoshikimate 1-carboxyvinyltransferase [Victivallales bacterium]|nr:3-phosphoshikimate 1-carboxyvinyltransferase [Victivallales bacterium]